MAEIRTRLLQATEEGDSEALSLAMGEFVKRGLEDRGELRKAKRKFYLGRINKGVYIICNILLGSWLTCKAF